MAGTRDPGALRRVRRDVGRLGKFERTPSGGVRIPADVTRIGVLEYPTEDGGTLRELRHPEDVLAEESWRSLEDAPVTNDHPDPDNGAEGFVTPGNWSELAVGAVRNVRVDGGRLAADIVVLDGETMRGVESGELVEVSLGYVCELEMVGGVYEGQQYDARQRRISYNHAALGPRGWGRAGPDVSLRLDGGHGGPMSARKVRVDGIEYEAGTDSHVQAVDKLIERKDADIARLTKELSEQKGRADGLETRAKKADEDLAATKKKLDAAASDEEIDKRVESRMGLVDAARRVLGDEYEYSGKSDRDVMKDALSKAGRTIADDADDSYVRGAFDAITSKDEPDGDESDPDKDFVGADSKRRTQKPATKADGKRKGGVRIDSDDRERPEPKSEESGDWLAAVEKKNAEYAAKFDSRFAQRKS